MKSIVTMDSLNLDNRCLLFSMVELESTNDFVEYYAAGIPDKYSLEDTNRFQDYAKQFDDDTEISVTVRSYTVGQGESEHPDEDELEFICAHWDELDERYGMDCIQSERFLHYYEPEEEY